MVTCLDALPIWHQDANPGPGSGNPRNRLNLPVLDMGVKSLGVAFKVMEPALHITAFLHLQIDFFHEFCMVDPVVSSPL